MYTNNFFAKIKKIHILKLNEIVVGNILPGRLWENDDRNTFGNRVNSPIPIIGYI